MIMKFYDNSDIFLRKVDESVLKNIIDKIFDTVMKNYSPNNPVYFSDKISFNDNTSIYFLCFYAWVSQYEM